MAKTFRCRIVTPADSAFDGDVTYVSFPAWDGQQGVMTGQSPLLTRLGIGPLRVEENDGRRESYFVDGGFAQIQDGTLTILTERALRPESIDRAKAESLLQEANQRVVSSGTSKDSVERDQRRARAMIAMSGAFGASSASRASGAVSS